MGKNCPYSEFFGPLFPAFGLNAEIYSVNLQVQYEYGKIRTRKNFVSMKKIDSLKKLDQVLIIRCKNHALQIKTLLTPGQMWQPVVFWKHFVIFGILSKKKFHAVLDTVKYISSYLNSVGPFYKMMCRC